ncbi:DUF6798 domain-containing protein [Thalassoroseus pseudoceratinae]|uniref:DUF6798 domain-containing protein n=1 Tax=Thalassoroseus pseudoceratinae TaxID=2713176 RepID=UPI0014216ADD|nr:DUF6798 domain-containing protein [Thalassoroseus pseudoceratinae]
MGEAVATQSSLSERRRWTCLVGLAVWGSFLLVSAWQSPVPSVNEPHYLARAKHFWQPEFAPSDFFLNSSETHYVFYLTVGWLTKFTSFATAAWVGRGVALGLLAFGWTKLSRSLGLVRWAPLYAAWLFLAMQSVGNFSGEWVVGGVEGKVFSYGLLFAGIAHWLDSRLYRCAVCLGLAISFHPVVGIWGVICGGFAELLRRMATWKNPSVDVIPWSKILIAIGILTVCALPGIVPALQTLADATPKQTRQGTYIHVFIRLRHHLDPMEIPLGAYLGYGVLLAVWLLIRPETERTTNDRWWTSFVLGSVLIAIVGIGLGWGPRPALEMPYFEFRQSLLKFYPFRLVDIALPMAVSLMAARLGMRWVSQPLRRFALFAIVFAYAVFLPSANRNPSRMKPERLADWLATCEWVRENTPTDAVFYTPRSTWAFKWYAERAEYFAYKDIPQDAVNVVEWFQRSNEELRDVLRKPNRGGLTHVIFETDQEMSVKPLFQRGRYQVFRLDDLLK